MPKSAARLAKEGTQPVAPATTIEIGIPVAGEPKRAVYFDPGDRYTGVAVFERTVPTNGWDCVDAFTWDIEVEAIDGLHEWLKTELAQGKFDRVGYEVWRLFEDKAQEQKGSEFLATQLIGVIKYLHGQFQELHEWPAGGKQVDLVRFFPENKKPTAGILKTRGVGLLSRALKTKGDHAYDAELQGYYDLIHNLNQPIAQELPF